jgi:hypothetical protein
MSSHQEPAEHVDRTPLADSGRVVTNRCVICMRSAARCRCATSVRETVRAVLLLVAVLILLGGFLFYSVWVR